MATFIQTQRDCNKLVYNKYTYNKVKDGSNGKRYWRCDELGLKCGGTAITDEANNVHLRKPHSHAPSPTKITIKSIKSRIKDSAASRGDTPRDLVNGAIERINDGVKMHLPELKNLQKMVTRKRLKIAAIPLVPHSLAEITIPVNLRLTRTTAQENFLIQDTGVEDENRIIILGSTTDINRLTRCSTWVIDGTFKSAPNLWYQLWVVHGIYFNKTIPFVFAFLPNKTEVTYERVVEFILTKIDSVSPGARPSTIIIDYEQAVINVFKRLIPNISLHGCFFHYCQAIWRKVKELGMVRLYTNDDYFRTLIKSFSALAFVTPQQIPDAFESLANELIENFGDDEMNNSFLEYFMKTWVGRRVPRRNPLYPIDMWNCQDISLEGLPRTTNSVESWHHAFASIFSSHHPNPYKVMEKLLKEQTRSDFICTRLENGQTVNLYSRIEYRKANERLLNVIRDFGNRNLGDFLQTCSYYIHYND